MTLEDAQAALQESAKAHIDRVFQIFAASGEVTEAAAEHFDNAMKSLAERLPVAQAVIARHFKD